MALIMTNSIKSIQTFIFSLERDVPYLGPLAEGETVNRKGYIVRHGNGAIYPSVDRSVLVRVETDAGEVGWGETYGICAPRAVCEIINDLLAPVVEGCDPKQPEKIWGQLYDLMRVRGFWGGFYVDALAAIDIALWDIKGKIEGKPISRLLGQKFHAKLPAYISGLPAAQLDERVAIAENWICKGFGAVKFHTVVSHQGIVKEAAALRKALGPHVKLMIDLHWKFSESEAVALLRELEPFDLEFVEAPVKPENVQELARVASSTSIKIAAGEEWRTEYEALPRIEANAISIIQPEMGHTGITQFIRIAELARQRNILVAPHATIGAGIFMAASLHASSCVENLHMHEYQHSIFDRNSEFLSGPLTCELGYYAIPEGHGLGVEPTTDLLQKCELVI